MTCHKKDKKAAAQGKTVEAAPEQKASGKTERK